MPILGSRGVFLATHFEKTGQRYYFIVDSLINGNIKVSEPYRRLTRPELRLDGTAAPTEPNHNQMLLKYFLRPLLNQA